ncbi:MAG: hypothetical protein Q7J98_14275 [Kiritimatiellia bacterium]|nr:hypothetical protein [Kiritimatiellia bacterium]
MKTMIVGLVLALAGMGICAQTGEVIFSDSFQAPQLAADWKVQSGKWAIEDGCLAAQGTAVIALDKPLSVQFELEAELNYKGRMTFFFDTEKSSYLQIQSVDGQLGQWFFVERDDGNNLLFYSNHQKDRDITPGVLHKIKVTYDCGIVKFYCDGKLKETATFRFNPDPRLTLSSSQCLSQMPYLRIKSFGVRKTATELKTVFQLRAEDFAKGAIYADDGLAGKPVSGERLSGADDNGAALKYSFKSGDVFESRFARIPLEVACCKRILVEVEGDGSGNNVFIILHDRSGEQHLVSEIPLKWEGRREIGVNLGPFLELTKERSVSRWGGDENQKIDFPIQAIDIGVAKRGARVKDSGEVKFRNLRFIE